MKKILLSLAVMASVAFAGDTSATTTINMHIDESCAVTTEGLAIEYNGIDDAAGEFGAQVLCTKGSSFTVDLNEGTHADAAQNKMTNAAGGELLYDIFSDAAHTVAHSQIAVASAPADIVPYTFYALVPKSQAFDSANTAYSDVVTMTVNW